MLRCPAHGAALRHHGEALVCAHGDRYRVVDGIPLLLRPEVRQTRPHLVRRTLEYQATHGAEADAARPAAGIDAFVQHEVGGTGGYMYHALVGRLASYPIPALRMRPQRPGALLLDVGCGWGRWSVAAARAGFQPVGIDPSIEAVKAAGRIARQLGVEAHFLVADARYLPFASDVFDDVFSYSVWQHFEKSDTVLAMQATARVLRADGRACIQMGNTFGLRSLYHQARRGFRPARGFDVRYWRPAELRDAFARHIGPTDLSVDGYFSLNPQPADRHLMPRRYRWVVNASEAVRRASRRVKWLRHMADSVYVEASRHQSGVPG
jgi:SAM-dependent methyltransferase